MKVPRVVKAMEYIDDELITAAATYAPKKKQPVWLKWGAMAACLCLIMVGIIGLPHLINQPTQPNSDYEIDESELGVVYMTLEEAAQNKTYGQFIPVSFIDGYEVDYIKVFNSGKDNEKLLTNFINTKNDNSFTITIQKKSLFDENTVFYAIDDIKSINALNFCVDGGDFGLAYDFYGQIDLVSVDIAGVYDMIASAPYFK